jgi:hypothetical protein
MKQFTQIGEYFLLVKKCFRAIPCTYTNHDVRSRSVHVKLLVIATCTGIRTAQLPLVDL